MASLSERKARARGTTLAAESSAAARDEARRIRDLEARLSADPLFAGISPATAEWRERMAIVLARAGELTAARGEHLRALEARSERVLVFRP